MLPAFQSKSCCGATEISGSPYIDPSSYQIANCQATGVPTLDTSHLVTVIVLVVALKVTPAQANVNVSKGH